MAQQGEKKRSDGSCGAGGSRSSKKQKRPPQRGVGIAELERLRLEELQRNNAAFIPFPSFSSSASLPSFPVTSEFNPSEARSQIWDFESNTIRPVMPNTVVGSGHPFSLRYQSEPPSNQIHRGRAPAPFSPQEERLGAKRSSHLASDNQPPFPCFPFKIHKVGDPIASRSEGPSRFSRVDNLRVNLGEGSSRSSSVLGSSSTDSVKKNKVNESEYLPLAPSVDDPLHSQHFGSGALTRHNLQPGFEFSQYPGHRVGQPMQLPSRPPYYNFLLPGTPPDNSENAHNEGGRENFGEGSSRSSSMLGSSSADSIKKNKVNDLPLAPQVDDPLHSQHFGSGALRRYNLHPGFQFSQYPGHPVGQPMQLPSRPPYYNFLPPVTPPPPDNIENAHNEGGSEDSPESIDLNLKL